MAPHEAAMVAAARACLGIRFRLHGRSAAGLDCIGLAAIAYGKDRVPAGYALRGGDPEQVSATIESLGLTPAVDPARPGDPLLLQNNGSETARATTNNARKSAAGVRSQRNHKGARFNSVATSNFR